MDVGIHAGINVRLTKNTSFAIGENIKEQKSGINVSRGAFVEKAQPRFGFWFGFQSCESLLQITIHYK